jgi:cytochrome c oxidase subunit 4
MSKHHRQTLFCWLALLLIAALEFGGSFIPLAPSHRPLLLLPAIGMVVLVGVMFMRVRRGAALVRGFALAGLVWLSLLLGLGTMDPLTRAVYPVRDMQIPR